MLVREWMNKEVITVDTDETMQQAIGLLKEHNIRMLPVMKNKKLVGIITDRDLKRASASDATSLEIHELLYLIGKIKISTIDSGRIKKRWIAFCNQSVFHQQLPV